MLYVCIARRHGVGKAALISGVVAAVLVLFSISWALSGDYVSEQTAERSFVIHEDFTKVRKIMVRTNAAREIITMGGTSEFVEQQWREGTVASTSGNIGEAILKTVFSNDPDWQLDLSGTLKVRTLDEYIGKEVVTLEQNVTIDPHRIESTTSLIEGSERLLGYGMTTRLVREENHTRIDLSLTQKIKTHAPWFAHRIADRRVHASAAHAIERQENAMRQLIEENQDQRWLFPLR